MSQLDNILEKLRRVAQDPDVDDKKGTQPKKYYSGVKKDKKDARDAHFKKGASMSDDNPNAYKEAPGDRDKDGKLKKTKPSKHTNKFKQMYGEATDKAQEKAKKEIDKLKKQMTKHSRVINSPTISITRISIAIDQLNKIKKQIEDIQKKAGLTGAFYEAVSPAQQAAIAIAKRKSGKYDKDGKRLEKEACWDGYKKVGMKKKGDKMVPNCVPEMNEKNKDITAISTWKKNLKKVKGLSKDTMQQLSMLPTPVITSLINQIGMIVAQYNEELGPNADAGDYIDDFRKSDAPQFKGKSDKKIRKMAIAAYLDSKEKK